MENNIKFRNHFSIVLQHMKGILWVLIMGLVSGLVGGDTTEILVTIAMWFLLGVVFVVWRIIIWAKTWIMIGEQTIVVECNTWFSKKKHTIGIANISNVNLEQSLFNMLIGTCKLKLDTNSLSTAETTDVTIVLKKVKAEEIKRLLLRLIEGETEIVDTPGEPIEKSQGRVEKSEFNGICIRGKDIILHGLYSSRFLYAIFVPLFILLQLVAEFAGEGDLEAVIDEVGTIATETIGLGVLILIAIIAWALLTMVISLVRNAVRYWDFRIERQKAKLILNYGLTKKVSYSIPVDKIQAVVLKQSMLARLCRRYMVEVINVGMNDDEKEVQAFLLPYGKKSALKSQLQQVLPEFAGFLDMKSERQPKTVWLVWLCPMLVYLLVAGVVSGLFWRIEPEFAVIMAITYVVLGILILMVVMAGYVTKGVMFADQVLLVVNGYFGCRQVFIKYDRIQHAQLQQDFIAKRVGIQKGVVFLLASAQSRAQNIPYFAEEKMEMLKKHL